MHVYKWKVVKKTLLVHFDPETCRHFTTTLWFLQLKKEVQIVNIEIIHAKLFFHSKNHFPLNQCPGNGSSICANGALHSHMRLSGGGGRCHQCSRAPERFRSWGRSEEWVCGDTPRGQVCGIVAPGSPRRSWTISASDLQNGLYF